jgi:hypothetical protein
MDNDRSRLLTVPSDERWVALVDSAPSANVFHHPAWMNLFAECYGYRPFVIAICNGKGEPRAGLPLMEVNSPLTGRRWMSLPFTDHCHPVYHGDTPPRELFEYLSELQVAHDIPWVELRSEIPYDGQVRTDKGQVLHLLTLSTDPQEVFTTFHRSQVRRNIARAEREGVDVRWAEDRRDLDAFYELHWGTRRRLGVPVQPRRYFRLLWQRIIDPGLGFILLACKDSLPIAGAVFLTYKDTLVYKYGASHQDYWRLRPNHLLFWNAIRWGCENGYRLFDWGRTSVSNTGLRDFKDGWGTQESPLCYTILSTTPPGHAVDRLSGITEAFIRRAPRWVCRVTGELFYGHFA